jgi:hypothetical protein
MPQLLFMHERPHQAVIHLQAPLRQLRNQASQREPTRPAAFQQPDPPRPPQLLRAVAADLAQTDAARSVQTLHHLIAVLIPAP